jgi:hypothetical protein
MKRSYSPRRSLISSIGLVIASLALASAFILLVAAILFSPSIDLTRLAILLGTVLVITPVLFQKSREKIKGILLRLIYGARIRGQNVTELSLPEMQYFIAGEEQDVVIVGKDGSYWGRGFLTISKTVRLQQYQAIERNRAKSRAMFEALIENAYSNKIPVQSIISLSPIDEDEAVSQIQDVVELSPSQIEFMSEDQRRSYVHRILGVWRSRVIMSTRSSTKPPTKVREIVDEVRSNILKLKALYTAAFPDYVVEKVAGRTELKKIATFMLTHSEGSSLMRDGGGIPYLCGKDLTSLMSIPNIVKNYFPQQFPYKEFQLPPRMENDILLGGILDDAGNPSSPVGLRTSDLTQGIVVIGEDPSQVDLTNRTLISKLVASSVPYLVFTTRTKHRALMSIIPNALTLQLGKDFIINPMDTEGIEPDKYIPLLLATFENSFPLNDEQANMLFAILQDVFAETGTPTLSMLKDHTEDIINSGKETLARTRLLEGILKSILSLLTGNAAEALSGSSTTEFKSLLETASPAVIIEFEGITDPTVVRFIQSMILAKLYSLYSTQRGARAVFGERMLLLEDAELVFSEPSLRTVRRYLHPPGSTLSWVSELCEHGVGLHISTANPSQIEESILSKIGTKIVHRISAIDDAKLACKHINFEYEAPIAKSGGTAAASSKMPLLGYLREGEALFVRPDLRKPIPIKLEYSDVAELNSPSDSEIRRRTSSIMLGADNLLRSPRTILEIDYPNQDDRRIAEEILELLEEYTDFGKGSVMYSFEGSDQPRVRELLPKLENFRYIISHNVKIERGALRRVYHLTEKGKKAIEEERRLGKEGESTTLQETIEATATSTGSSGENEVNEEAEKIRLRPIFMGAIGGFRRAKSLCDSGRYGLALRRVDETTQRFLRTLAGKVGVRIDREDQNNPARIIGKLRDAGLAIPPDENKITWISERAAASSTRQVTVTKEEALSALGDAVSFLKRTSEISHIE